MSRTYAVMSNKGGAGKTTMATLLAGEYALAGIHVLMVDADARQNLAGWWKLCHAKDNVPANIEVTSAATQRAIDDVLRTGRKTFDMIIIDAPGVDSVLQTTIIRSSDIVVSPLQPGIKEIEAAGQTVAEVNAINDALGTSIIHMNVRTRITLPGRNLEAYRYIRPFVAGLRDANYHTMLLDTELFDRNVYREIQNGLGTLQMQELTEPVRKARSEVKALAGEIEMRRRNSVVEVAA